MLKVIDPSVDTRWDEFVQCHPDGTVFHTSKWARVIGRSYGYVPAYVIGEDDRGRITSGMPFFLLGNRVTGRRLVSLPFTDRCAPLYSNTDDVARIIRDLEKVAVGMDVRRIEIRSGNTGVDDKCAPAYHRFAYYRLFMLDLDQGLDRVWQGFKQKSVRYPIRKAEASGVNVRQGVTEADMHVFHRLNVITRKRHGVIPQPYRFFENIFRELLTDKLAILLIAEHREKPIAASIFFTYRNTMHYKFNCSSGLYGSCQPNHLILWQAIKDACSKGFRSLDMGRTSPDNRGLIAFKRHWGARETDLPYYFFPDVRNSGGTLERGRLYGTATSILRKMPAAILERFGGIAYKYFA